MSRKNKLNYQSDIGRLYTQDEVRYLKLEQLELWDVRMYWAGLVLVVGGFMCGYVATKGWDVIWVIVIYMLGDAVKRVYLAKKRDKAKIEALLTRL